MDTCERKEKHQFKIEHDLNLEKRKNGKSSARIRRKRDLKDNSRARRQVDNSSKKSVKYIESSLET